MLLTLLSSLVLANTPTCGDRLRAFSTYEDLEKGQIVDKHSIYPIGLWSDASAFEGILIQKADAEGVKMIFELRPHPGSKAVRGWEYSFTPWSRDANYLIAKGFSPLSLMQDAQGVFSVALKKGSTVICKDTHGISAEGDNP